MKEERLKEFAYADNYLANIPIKISTHIWEYDIRQANISCLLSKGIISKDQFDTLSAMPKINREVITQNTIIGRNLEIQKAIKDTIREAKYLLMKENNVDISKVIRIANDAVYYESPYPLGKTSFTIGNGNIVFACKNCFDAFININRILLFMSMPDGGDWNVDVKGINDKFLPLHEKFIGFIFELVQAVRQGGKDIALRRFNQFYNDYVNLRLPIEYYREFNSDSCYRLCNTEFSWFYSKIAPNDINKIDINWNLNILRYLYSYILQI